MAYRQGDIVVIPFPFTDLSQQRRRPALVVSNDRVNATGDYLLVQITSRNKNDGLSVALEDDSYAESTLPVTSYVRVHKIFCLNESLIEKKVTATTESFLKQVTQQVSELLQPTSDSAS